MKSDFYKFICFLLAISVIQSHDDDFSSHQTEQEIDNEIDETIITYGSNLKIQNFLSKFYPSLKPPLTKLDPINYLTLLELQSNGE